MQKSKNIGSKIWKIKEKYLSLTFGRRYFRSKLKINANLFGSLLAYSYLCTQNNGRVPFIGIGVSPIGRVVRFVAAFFLCLLRGIYLKYVSCSYIMQRYEDSESAKCTRQKLTISGKSTTKSGIVSMICVEVIIEISIDNKLRS